MQTLIPYYRISEYCVNYVIYIDSSIASSLTSFLWKLLTKSVTWFYNLHKYCDVILVNKHFLIENKHCHLAGRLMRKRIIKTPSFPWMLQHNSLSQLTMANPTNYTQISIERSVWSSIDGNSLKFLTVNNWLWQICRHSGKKFEYEWERERVDDNHL